MEFEEDLASVCHYCDGEEDPCDPAEQYTIDTIGQTWDGFPLGCCSVCIDFVGFGECSSCGGGIPMWKAPTEVVDSLPSGRISLEELRRAHQAMGHDAWQECDTDREWDDTEEEDFHLCEGCSNEYYERLMSDD